MMEEIVLLETIKVLGKTRRTFKMTFAGAEFDMVIFDEKLGTCECYEIKHSDQIAAQQTKHLTDEICLKEAERRFGSITKRCVIYRGADATLENGIIYRNVEEYLKAL